MHFGNFFLKDPARFPTSPTGTLWGCETVELAMAGTNFRVSGLSAFQASYIRGRYADFLTTDLDRAPVHMAIYRANPAEFRHVEQRGWTYTIDRDYAPTRVRVAGLNLMATLDWSPQLSATLWSATEADPGFPMVFDNVFRLISAYALLARGGVLLHSAGISDGTWAWIGFGHSGAGKSTLSGLALDAGQRVLSDDLNVLRHQAGSWWAERVPFAGTLGPTHGDDRAYPVAGLARLAKGAEHRLAALARPEALAALVGSAPYINQDPYRVQDLMALLESLLRTVDCHDLTFRKDPGFWPLLVAAARPQSQLPSSERDPESAHD